eukprot:scaffold17975_cov98-Skeletonema_marinoi.AAC.1
MKLASSPCALHLPCTNLLIVFAFSNMSSNLTERFASFLPPLALGGTLCYVLPPWMTSSILKSPDTHIKEEIDDGRTGAR